MWWLPEGREWVGGGGVCRTPPVVAEDGLAGGAGVGSSGTYGSGIAEVYFEAYVILLTSGIPINLIKKF